MDFDDISRLFRNTVTGILDSEQQIEEEHVKEASSILKKFSTLQLNDVEIKLFLDDILRYFVLLNQYTSQFREISASQHCTVRMGLGVFLFVLDSMHMYEKIFRKFQKIIDVVTESNPSNFNIKEFLRIYSHLLDKTPVDVLRNLVNKQKSLPIWYEIIKNTGDIETQTIIIEVVLKLFKCNNYMNIDETFLEVVQIADVSSIDKLNMYPNIRMILDRYNEYFSNIFSVNCIAIKLDSRRVVEFNGGVDDIWLDLNLLQNRLSFFCDRNFAASKVRMYPTSSTWEVLSFYAKDTLNSIFYYNAATENLEISLSIDASDINLLIRKNVNAVHKIDILVSRNSDRFCQFVKYLPMMFPETFSAEALGISPKAELDLSRTPDILQVGSCDSSPVIEHFEMRKKSSGKNRNSSFIAVPEAHEDSVILISDDEDEELVPPSKPKENDVFNGTLKGTKDKSPHVSVISKILSSKEDTNSKENKIVFQEKSKKTASFKHRNTPTVFDKSVSPLSFTESVLGRRSRPHSRNSEMAENNNVIKATKLSTITKVDTKEKISTVKKRSTMKISSSLPSAIIKPYKELNVDIYNQEMKKNAIEVLEVEERMMDATYMDVDLDASISKVENWLKSVDKDAPLSLDDMEYVPSKIPNCEDLNNLQDFLPSVSERGSIAPPKLPENEDIRDLPDGLALMSERGSIGPPRLSENEYLQDLPDRLASVSERGSISPPKLSQNEGLINVLHSERGSSMPLEEKMQLLMGSEENLYADQEKSKVSVVGENTVEGLLNILCSQGSKSIQNIEDTNKDDTQNSTSKKEDLSLDSNIPLSKLTKVWKRNREAVGTSADEIEVAEDDRETVANQSFAVTKENLVITSHVGNRDNNVIGNNRKNLVIDDGADNTEQITDQNPSKIDNMEAIEVVNKSPAITTLAKNIDVKNREKRTDQNIVISVHEKELDDDKTPDLEQLFKKQNSSVKKELSVNNDLNNTMDHVFVQPEVKSIRKLYNPADLSYLNTSLSDYLQSEEKTTNSPAVTPNIIHIRSRSSRSKGVKKPKSKNDKENKNIKKKHDTENKSILNITKNGTIKTNKQAATMTKSLIALKETFRQQKKRLKMEQKLKHKKAPRSSSSSSSMEPFGVAIKNLRKEKRKSLTLTENIPVKRLKEETQTSVKEYNESQTKKIRIISDVLIQPASVRPEIEQTSSEKCCCAQLVRMTSEFYLQFITHVSKTNPSLLSGDIQSAVIKILEGCVKP